MQHNAFIWYVYLIQWFYMQYGRYLTRWKYGIKYAHKCMYTCYLFKKKKKNIEWVFYCSTSWYLWFSQSKLISKHSWPNWASTINCTCNAEVSYSVNFNTLYTSHVFHALMLLSGLKKFCIIYLHHQIYRCTMYQLSFSLVVCLGFKAHCNTV